MRARNITTFIVGMRSNMQEYGDGGLPPEAIGELAFDILRGAKKKTRYAVLKEKFMSWTLPRLLPARMLDKAIAKRFGFSDQIK